MDPETHGCVWTLSSRSGQLTAVLIAPVAALARRRARMRDEVKKLDEGTERRRLAALDDFRNWLIREAA